MTQPYDIYVASSWRNEHYEWVIDYIAKHTPYNAYNFRKANKQFSFEDATLRNSTSPGRQWKAIELEIALKRSSVCLEAYMRDRVALDECRAFVIVMPCGKSAHLELGMALQSHKPCAMWFFSRAVPAEPELMALPADFVYGNTMLASWLYRHLA